MPAQTGKLNLGKYDDAFRKALDKHKGEDTKLGGFQEMPPNVTNGIAKVVEFGIVEIEAGKTNAGERQFWAKAIAVSPEFTSDGQKVRGLATNVWVPLYDTPTRARKTVDEHVGYLMSFLRTLDIDTSNLSGLEDLAVRLEAFKKAAPYIKFRTRQGKPTPQYPTPSTFHEWDGLADAPTAVSANGSSHVATGKSVPARAPDPAPSSVAGGYTDTADIDSLVEAAGGIDEAAQDAQRELMRFASEAGHSDQEIKDAESWEDVASLIRNPKAKKAGPAKKPAARKPEPVQTDEDPPKVGDTYGYRPPGSTRKIEVDVIRVDETAETVDLVDLSDKKRKWNKVSWDALEDAD